MKKRFGLIALAACAFALASCGEETVTRSDSLPATADAEYNLTAVAQGNALKDNSDEKSYYDIKLAANAKDTLFATYTYVKDTVTTYGTDIKAFDVYVLSFSDNATSANVITSEEKTAILSAAFDSKTGITNETLGLSYATKAVSSWDTAISIDVLTDGKLADGQTAYDYISTTADLAVCTIYVPVLAERYESKELSLSVFVMLPVYYELATVTDGTINSTNFAGISVKHPVNVTENNVLA